jgi:hypothetical protein
MAQTVLPTPGKLLCKKLTNSEDVNLVLQRGVRFTTVQFPNIQHIKGTGPGDFRPSFFHIKTSVLGP